MRNAVNACNLLCSLLLTLVNASLATAGPTPNSPRSTPSINPQIRRNNVDSTITWSDAAKESQILVKKLLAKVLQATPKPATPYALAQEEEVPDGVGAKSGMVKGTQRWVPIEAWARREYETGGDAVGDEMDDAPVDSKFLEIQVALNGTRGLTSGLATRSDKPHIKEIEGAVAVEQTSILLADSAQVEGDDPGRAPEEPMTLLRIYVVDPDLETHVRELQKATGAFPGFGPSQVLADHPDELRSIVISYYGPRSDVAALAKKIDIAALRRLLPG